MLLLFLILLAFQQALAFPRSSSHRKTASLIRLSARNIYRQQQALAQTEGAIPVFPIPVTLRTHGELPILSFDTSEKLGEAKNVLKTILKSREKTIGTHAIATLDTINDIANISINQGNYSEAFMLYERVAKRKLLTMGEKDPETLLAFSNLAVVWSLLRKVDTNAPNRIFFQKYKDYVSHQSFGIVFGIKPKYHITEEKEGFYFHFKDLYEKLSNYLENCFGVDLTPSKRKWVMLIY